MSSRAYWPIRPALVVSKLPEIDRMIAHCIVDPQHLFCSNHLNAVGGTIALLILRWTPDQAAVWDPAALVILISAGPIKQWP